MSAGAEDAPVHVMGIPELEAFLEEHFEQAVGFSDVADFGEGALTLRLRSTERHLRPGGTISGPTIFTLADLAFYQLTLSLIGPVPLAVTTQLNLSFMRRPDPGLLEATATMLKLGRRLAVGDVLIEGEEGPVAHAQVTYSIPPPEKR